MSKINSLTILVLLEHPLELPDNDLVQLHKSIAISSEIYDAVEYEINYALQKGYDGYHVKELIVGTESDYDQD